MSEMDKNFRWNAAAGLVNAAEAVILLMVAGRTNGLEDAGILTIAFAVGNLFVTVGKYGVRNYQVTDLENRFCFTAYYSQRILSVLLMGTVTAAYMTACRIWKGYSWYKISIVVLICMIYMVESLEDVFWGYYQKNGHLDLGAKIFAGRWLLHLLIASAMLVFTRNLTVSLLAGLAGGAVFSICANRKQIAGSDEKPEWKPALAFPVFKACFPLFLSTFMTNYVANAPKYAIDRYMPSTAQACYGYIAMPVFVVSLLNSFLYQPLLVDLTVDWKEKRLKKFRRRLYRQFAFLVLLTAACVAGGFVCGIPVLSFLYHVDLSSYQAELVILLAAGGLQAAAAYAGVVMTIMRIQKKVMYGYGTVSVAACLCTGRFVREYGVRGAAWLYAGWMACLALFFIGCIYQKLYEEGKISGCVT